MSDGRPLTPVLLRMLEGRVGSTLVMQLLGSSAAIAFDREYPFENSYLTYLARLASQLDRDPSETDTMGDLVYSSDRRVAPLPFVPRTVSAPELARRALGALWDAFSESVVDRRAVRYYAEKFWGDVEPLHGAGLRPIVIDLVRDPRDIIASIRAFNAKTGIRRFGRDQVETDGQHLARLVVGMGFRLRQMDSPMGASHAVLRYEDVASDLDATARSLGRLLGLELDPGKVLSTHSSMAGHMTSPSVEASVGRWRADLSDEEVALVERRLGPAMARLGYETVTR